MSELVNNYDISVIVPVYNVEEYLAECLDSVIDFTDCNIEVLIIDDGSTDGSAEIAKRYAKKYSFVKYYYEENAGLGHARNYGVTFATGKYIIFLDSDDVVTPNAYDKMLALAEKNNSELTICNVIRFNSQGIIPSWLHKRVFNSVEANTHITKNNNLIYDTTSWNKLILRSFYLKNNFQFPEGILYEDIPVTIPMHYLANNVSVLNSYGYMWRIRDGANKSITQRASELKNFEDRMLVIKMVDDFFKENVSDESLILAKNIKLLEIDFMIYINQFGSIDLELAETYYSFIRDYINTNMDASVLDMLSPIVKQKYLCILNNDLNKLRELLKYQNSGYSRAPLIEDKGVFSVKLPENLFDAGGNILRDVTQYTPNTRIDSVEFNDNVIEIVGCTYYNRINVCDSSEQKFRASFLNERSFENYALNCESVDGSAITEMYGVIVDEYTSEVSQYNYDGSCYKITIDLESIDLEKLLGDNKIVVEYENRISNGFVYLTGLNAARRRTVDGQTFLIGDYSIHINFNANSYISFDVKKNAALAEKVYCKDGNLVYELNNDVDRIVLVNGDDSYDFTKISPAVFSLPIDAIDTNALYDTFYCASGSDKLSQLLRKHKKLRIDSVPNGNVLISSFKTYCPRIIVDECIAESISCTQDGDQIILSAKANISNPSSVTGVFLCVDDPQQKKYKKLVKGKLKIDNQSVYSKFKVDFSNEKITGDLYESIREVLIKYVYDDGKIEYRKVYAKKGFNYSFNYDTLSLSFYRSKFGNLRLKCVQEWSEQERLPQSRKLLKLENYPKFRKEPINNKLILFESMWGTKYSCNPKYLYEYIDKNYPDYTCVWSFKDQRTPINGNGIRVRRGSQEYYHYMATAKYLINNVNFETDYVKRKGQIEVQTMHGTPLKTLGLDVKADFPDDYAVEQYVKKCKRWDYLIVQNQFMQDKAYQCFKFDRTILKTGYPRTDGLYNNSEKKINKIKENLGLPKDKKIILYLPTWRVKNKFNMEMDIEKLREHLSDDYVLILRFHHLCGNVDLELDADDRFVYDLTKYNSVEDLYIISDLMITDYSSVMFDYAILKKPMIFFVYDLEDYSDNLRGTYVDIVKEAPGPLVYNNDELVDVLLNLDEKLDQCKERTEAFYQKYTTYENGRSCAKVVEKVIKPIGRRERIKRIKRKLRIK